MTARRIRHGGGKHHMAEASTTWRRQAPHGGGKHHMAEASTTWRKQAPHGGGKHHMAEASTTWWRQAPPLLYTAFPLCVYSSGGACLRHAGFCATPGDKQRKQRC